jgi:hypothetical protein
MGLARVGLPDQMIVFVFSGNCAYDAAFWNSNIRGRGETKRLYLGKSYGVNDRTLVNNSTCDTNYQNIGLMTFPYKQLLLYYDEGRVETMLSTSEYSIITIWNQSKH